MQRVTGRVLAATFAALLAAEAEASNTYEIRYHHVLTNQTNAPLSDVVVYLPVPASVGVQQVSDFRLERDRPVHISNRTDAYGTKIKRVAIARIEPGQSVNVGFSCVVAFRPPPRMALDEKRGQSLDEIPQDIRGKYTADHHIFGLATPIIRDTAAKLLREHPNPVDRAKAIHDLVAGTFHYKGGEGWDPAPEVLARKSGSCSEFAYVFCALCRATGIPTRFAGGSIFPLKSTAPFTDKGWHRWAEAYLPGHGWTPFDPTLDRARLPRQDFVGAHHPRVLVLTRIGSKSLQLGLSYIGANSHTGQTKRARHFVWTRDLRPMIAEARAMMESGRADEAQATLKRLIEKYGGSRAADEAARILANPSGETPTSQPATTDEDVEPDGNQSPDPDSTGVLRPIQPEALGQSA